MKPNMLGWIQLVGAALALYFDRAVFTEPEGSAIAIAVIAVVLGIIGLHHLAGEKAHR